MEQGQSRKRVSTAHTHFLYSNGFEWISHVDDTVTIGVDDGPKRRLDEHSLHVTIGRPKRYRSADPDDQNLQSLANGDESGKEKQFLPYARIHRS